MQNHRTHDSSRGSGPGQAWREEELVAAFVAQTSGLAEERRDLFDFACDLFPFEPDASIRVVDIGAGYGAFAEAVLDWFPNASAIGLDISQPMMAVGRGRMARFGDRFSYFAGDFSDGDLPAGLPGPFDAVVASASILHLQTEEKRQLYASIYQVLNPGGCFFIIEPVAPPNEEMEAWYQERREQQYLSRGDQPVPLAEHSFMQHHHFESEAAYRAHQSHHHVETESDQLSMLRAAGFVRVDCSYKKLLETIIGGYKAR